MHRREFSRSLLATGAGVASVGFGMSTAFAQRVAPKEGVEYIRLGRPAPTESPAGQIEVVEFFAYSCVHCYNFEPLFEDWIQKKPADVAVRRVPVAFSQAFVPMQRLYYTLEEMQLVRKLHAPFFKAIHAERLPLTNPGNITEWVVKQGVDRGRFTEVFNSGAVNTKAQRATALQEAYAVEGTPSLGVAGKFYIGGQGPRTLVIANALIAEARKG